MRFFIRLFESKHTGTTGDSFIVPTRIGLGRACFSLANLSLHLALYSANVQ